MANGRVLYELFHGLRACLYCCVHHYPLWWEIGAGVRMEDAGGIAVDGSCVAADRNGFGGKFGRKKPQYWREVLTCPGCTLRKRQALLRGLGARQILDTLYSVVDCPAG